MEAEIVNPEDLYLEESDFDGIKYSQPISLIFLLTCFLVYSTIFWFLLYLNLDSEAASAFTSLYLILLVVFLILIGNKKTNGFILKQRLKKTLNYYSKVRITFDYDLGEFSYDPHSPPALKNNIIYFYLIFIAESIVLSSLTQLFSYWFSNPTNLQILFYSIGFIIISFGFLTFVIL